HPAKAEVRFRDPALVRGLIIGALRHALAGAGHRASTTVAASALGGFRPGGAGPSPSGFSAWSAGGWRPTGGAAPNLPGVAEVSARYEPAPFEMAVPATSNVVDPTDFPLGAARAQVHETYI